MVWQSLLPPSRVVTGPEESNLIQLMSTDHQIHQIRQYEGTGHNDSAAAPVADSSSPMLRMKQVATLQLPVLDMMVYLCEENKTETFMNL